MAGPVACRAVVLTCIDFRIVPWLGEFLRRQGLLGAADVIAWPGGGASLALDGGVITDALTLSMDLHGPSEVILVAHEDCGGIGDAGRQISEIERLLRAGSIVVRSLFPGAAVRMALVHLDGTSRVLDPN